MNSFTGLILLDIFLILKDHYQEKETQIIKIMSLQSRSKVLAFCD